MKTKFLLADEVSPDVAGKHIVKGLYADDTVVLTLPPDIDPKSGPAVVESITCLVAVSGLRPGPYKIKGRLVDPQGVICVDIAPIDYEITAAGSHVFPFQLKPFAATGGSGVYRWTFKTDGREFSHEFAIHILPAEQTESS